LGAVKIRARLLGDIGGTNARFAWQWRPNSPITMTEVYQCRDFESLAAVIDRYLADHNLLVPPDCSLGIATPIIGDQVKMTNSDWTFSIAELKDHFGFERLILINDFTALALALPELDQTMVYQIGQGKAVPACAKALIGAGTGLGVSGLLPRGDGAWVPISGEGGHVSLAGQTEEEDAVISYLRNRFGHVSAERALSGAGLVNLYEACADLAGRPLKFRAAEQVLEASESDADCARAVALFAAFLGATAGDLALTLGARGGVYIGGGIAPRLLAALNHSEFRRRFEGKGRFQPYLAAIPTWVIVGAQSPAFIGASNALAV
jgi:glucokinase